MNRFVNLNSNSRPCGVLICQNRAPSQRVIIGNLKRCPITFFRGPLQTNSHARQSFFCKASSSDPDDYELDTGYDSDDYELFEMSAAAPRTAAHKSSSPAASTSSTSSSSSGSKQREQFIYSYPGSGNKSPSSSQKGRSRASTRQAIKSGFNIFLLFGAAIDRFVSRAQAAGFAAGLAMLEILKKAFHISSRKVDTVTVKARHSFSKSPVGKKVDKWAQSVNEVQQELPEDTWGKLLWLWDRPPVQRIRLTISMANLSIRLPALLALVATQVGLLASQVSLPMLAPLLLGTGMLLRSVKTNASFLLPRIGLLVVMLWLLWFANSVVHNTVAYLRKQNALDNRIAGGIITVSECSTLVVALVVVLSMLGVNVSALLLPAGIAVAVAAKDLSHNFLAGLFLFVVQPFKLGDRLSVSSAAPGIGGPAGGWFEGVCEKVDLRYVIVRQGRRRLMVPNSAFITREFMVMDEGPVGPGEAPPPPPPGSNQHQIPQQYMTNDYRHVWQYVEGPPVHQELAGTGVQGYPRYPPPPPPPPPMPSQMPGQQHQHEQQKHEVAAGINGGTSAKGGTGNGPVSYPLPDYTTEIPSGVNGSTNGVNLNGQQGSASSSSSSPPSSMSSTAAAGAVSAPQPPLGVGTYSYVVNNGTPGSNNTTTMHYYTQEQPTAAPMNSLNGGVATGYWQQQQQPGNPPPPPPPMGYWQQQQYHQQQPHNSTDPQN